MSLVLLTDAQLRNLTGYARRSAQRDWLRERGWVFEVGADGKAKVLLAYAEKRLGAKDADPPKWEPDFSDLESVG